VYERPPEEDVPHALETHTTTLEPKALERNSVDIPRLPLGMRHAVAMKLERRSASTANISMAKILDLTLIFSAFFVFIFIEGGPS
jgi:hypothetical protein